MPTLIRASNWSVLMGDGRVLGAGREIESPSGVNTNEFPDCILAPAFFDVHIHGSAGHDVMQPSREGQQRMCDFLARHGTARFLPTTVTAPVDTTLRALETMAGWIERSAKQQGPSARPVGIHLEGPFLSPKKCGVQPVEHMQRPDPILFDRFFEAARGHIKLMTVAPELLEALDLIRHATERGVRVSLGHSDATAGQAQAGIKAGAVSATHTFNAMRGFDHREPGLLGAVLDSEKLYAELICDGQHVAPEAVRMFAKCKRADRRILVTDAISAAGEGDGEFPLGGWRIQVSRGRAELNGKLAGSVLTLDRAVLRFAEETSLPINEAALAAGANAARMLGLEVSIREGELADFVVLDSAGRLRLTCIGGSLSEKS